MSDPVDNPKENYASTPQPKKNQVRRSSGGKHTLKMKTKVSRTVY